jgi:hypothetical protein
MKPKPYTRLLILKALSTLRGLQGLNTGSILLHFVSLCRYFSKDVHSSLQKGLKYLIFLHFTTLLYMRGEKPTNESDKENML